MYSLLYVSSAARAFTAAHLRELLAVCDSNNRRDDISGLLLYKDGNFMQLLEGPEVQVLATHRRICADRRHHGLITIVQGSQSAREFPRWSMGFRDLDSASDRPAAYSDFLNTSLKGREFTANAGHAQKLLKMFKDAR